MINGAPGNTGAPLFFLRFLKQSKGDAEMTKGDLGTVCESCSFTILLFFSSLISVADLHIPFNMQTPAAYFLSLIHI